MIRVTEVINKGRSTTEGTDEVKLQLAASVGE